MSDQQRFPARLIKRGWRYLRRLRLRWRLFRLNRKVAAHAHPDPDQPPVVFFNASARLIGLNLNAAFQLIASWSVQLAGAPVVHFACHSGMSHCVLGAGLGDPTAPPPCEGCIADTRRFTGAAPTVWFDYQEDPALKAQVAELPVPDLKQVRFQDIPLGELVLPSIRWILRRHHLQDDPQTRYLYREFILSAYRIAVEFEAFLAQVEPAVVVVFNGLQYPEAVVRWMAHKHDIRVITHEVNLRPFSAFFTEGHATIYPIDLPEDFELSEAQNQRLDRYLNQRFQGEFTMAGIKFWEGMNQLDETFLDHASQFEQIVPVFTNVVFDTSQAHANTLFSDMFAWLDILREVAPEHPDTLFVVRAHPDEMRPGKQSRETVADWIDARQLDQLPNVTFVGPDEILSSYDLIARAKFALVYNSSIGLEAVLLGTPVLCGGKARYTQYPIVFYPESAEAYRQMLEDFLEADQVQVTETQQRNARRFLYTQLYRVALSFADYLKEGPFPGYVELERFHWRKLNPERSPVLKTIVEGILEGEEFVLPNNDTQTGP